MGRCRDWTANQTRGLGFLPSARSLWAAARTATARAATTGGQETDGQRSHAQDITMGHGFSPGPKGARWLLRRRKAVTSAGSYNVMRVFPQGQTSPRYAEPPARLL
jgi:hypothetical protein